MVDIFPISQISAILETTERSYFRWLRPKLNGSPQRSWFSVNSIASVRYPLIGSNTCCQVLCYLFLIVRDSDLDQQRIQSGTIRLLPNPHQLRSQLGQCQSSLFHSTEKRLNKRTTRSQQPLLKRYMDLLHQVCHIRGSPKGTNILVTLVLVTNTAVHLLGIDFRASSTDIVPRNSISMLILALQKTLKLVLRRQMKNKVGPDIVEQPCQMLGFGNV